MNNPARAAILLLACALSACGGSTTAVIDSLRHAVSRNSTAAAVDQAPLNPAFRYLRASTDGRVALLVLGYVEQHPKGPIEVWYSADRETLRIQNGRIVGAAGLRTEWRNVAFTLLPSWGTVAATGSAKYLRTRDLMPGYRYGIKEELLLGVTPPPAKSEIRVIDPSSLIWFSESVIRSDPASSRDSRSQVLPSARYAVALAGGSEEVVYAEQCLADDLCLTWQRWPARASPSK